MRVAYAAVALTVGHPEGAPAGTRGLAMFLAPKRLAAGTNNARTVNRLKDKLGSRSMATGEVTYSGAVAHVVGDIDKGFKQMMEMVNGSRWPGASQVERELEARPVADTLYHVLAGGLLLAEGQLLLDGARDFRKLLAAALYLKRSLRSPEPPAARCTSREIEWVEALADWRSVPETALAVVSGS